MEQVGKLIRAWNSAPALQIIEEISEKYCPCFYLFVDQVWWVNELWFKRNIQITWPKGCVALSVEASYSKLAPRLVQCPHVFCKQRYNVFDLLLDLTGSPNLGIKQIYRLKFLAVCITLTSLVTREIVIVEMYF